MNDIFNEETKKALENAQRLKHAGEPELSRLMCVHCVEKNANYHDEDLISLFYGQGAYDEIKDATDAAKYIFIAKCARNVYDAIAPQNPASYSASPWARVSNVSNKQFKDFFTWLQKRNRHVETTDCNYFKGILKAYMSIDEINFKMSDYVKDYSLLEIVRMLVSGAITINNSGELV